MAVKVQYVASDNRVFGNKIEAEVYEKELERASKPEREYHVVFTIECDCYVSAHDEEEAVEWAEDEWGSGNLTDRAYIYDVQVYENKEAIE